MKIITLSRPRAALLAGVASLALAACGSQGSAGSEWTIHPPEPAPSGSPAASPGGSPAASPGGSPAASPGGSPGGSPGSGEGTIALTETPALQIQRDGEQVSEIALTEGQTYTFEITNAGGLEHNFYIGPPEQLQANDVAELPGVPNFTDGTQTFEYTATAETAGLEFACTVPGHYEPMHGALVVEP
ncbi:hypothetical protein BH24CHL8_BH24CHL8_03690 [soil metagenome]